MLHRRRQRDDAADGVARVPLWLASLVALQLIAVFVLAALLIRATMGPTADERSSDRVIASLREEAMRTRDPAVLIDLGFEYRKVGRLEEALETMERAVAEDPRNVAAHYHRGAILLEMGRHAQAEEALWDALEIDPEHAMTAKALGELYAERGHYRSLLVAVAPAAEANPALADLQYLLGLGRERTGDLSGALDAYREALERDPGLVPAREGLKRVGGENR